MKAHCPPLAGAACSIKEIIKRGWTKKMNRILIVQVCDARDDDSSTKADYTHLGFYTQKISEYCISFLLRLALEDMSVGGQNKL